MMEQLQMILSFSIECDSVDQFLSHWSERYRYPEEYKYEQNVGRPLTQASRNDLFTWKNGSKLSRIKCESVVHNYPLSPPKHLAERYLDPKSSGGPIWNIFYMHCIDPHMWPIFDQNTYRAMRFMRTGNIENVPQRAADVYEKYVCEFIPFVNELKADQRKIDKALFAFGKFLKIASAYR